MRQSDEKKRKQKTVCRILIVKNCLRIADYSRNYIIPSKIIASGYFDNEWISGQEEL